MPPKKRLPLAATLLNEQAPCGTYELDEVVKDARCLGRLVEIRQRVNLIALFANARNAATAPQKHQRELAKWLSKRLFSDLNEIQHLIKRNLTRSVDEEITRIFSGLDHSGLNEGTPNEIRKFLVSLKQTEEAIDHFLAKFKSAPRRGGNHDPFTCTIIEGFADRIWIPLIWGKAERGDNKSKIFIQLLYAAWRDLRIPTAEKEGRNSKIWLADRVRRQIPEGIRRRRLKKLAEPAYEGEEANFTRGLEALSRGPPEAGPIPPSARLRSITRTGDVVAAIFEVPPSSDPSP